MAVGIRHSYEFVKNEFENEGYTLLSDEYINNRQKLDYVCPKGHESSINYRDWGSGRRCYICGRMSSRNKQKHTSFYIINSLENEGYILMGGYINNRRKLEFICPNGHEHSISWKSWVRGYRCQICARNAKLTIEFIREEFEKEGYELLTKNYKNSTQKLKYICPNEHKHEISWSNWNKGARCVSCFYIKNSGSGHPMWKGGISCEPYCQDWTKEFKDYIKERDGYRCLNPDCWGTSKRLSIHHIDYNKKNCSPNNLITLCTSCNSRANKDRKWHTDWYRAIMTRRYDYKY